MRLPAPAPRLSKITTSSPSGAPSRRRASRLKGTPISQRAPARLGWARDSVTVPITSAMRMAVQLPKSASDPGRAGRARGRAQDAEDLPDLEKGPPRHLDSHQVRPEAEQCTPRLGDGTHGRGP